MFSKQNVGGRCWVDQIWNDSKRVVHYINNFEFPNSRILNRYFYFFQGIILIGSKNEFWILFLGRKNVGGRCWMSDFKWLKKSSSCHQQFWITQFTNFESLYFFLGLGERMSEEDVECLIHGQEDSQGNINYEQFVRMVLVNN